MPSLRSVKQSIQARNTQLLLVSISWKFQHYPSIRHPVMSQTHMDTECRKMNPVSKGFNRSFPKCFRLFPLWQLIYVLTISLKSTHPFYHNVPNRHAVAPRWETLKPSRQAWNSLKIFYLCRPWHFMKISWKSVHPFFHNITNKNTDPGNRKINPGFNELTTTSQKCSSSFFISCANFAEIFYENPFIRFPVILLKDTDFLENIEKET